MSIRQLCETLEVNRRWYDARLAQGETADPDVELRDATLADHPGVCRLWLSTRDPRTGASGLECESQAGAAHHARRVAPVPFEAPICANDRFASCLSGLSQFGERPSSGCP